MYRLSVGQRNAGAWALNSTIYAGRMRGTIFCDETTYVPRPQLKNLDVKTLHNNNYIVSLDNFVMMAVSSSIKISITTV